MNAVPRTLLTLFGRALFVLALVTRFCASAWAAEPCPATSRDLLAAEEGALAAYGALDLDGFVAETGRIKATLTCLVEPVTRDLVAGAHRMIGLEAFIAGDKERAALAFAAARSLEPEWRFPESLFPAGHPVRGIYESYPLERAQWAPLPPTSAVVRVDGRTADARPAAWPALVQVFGADGRVLSSAYLWPEDPLPALPAALPPQPVAAGPGETDLTTKVEPERSGPRWGWIGVAAVSAGSAATMYSVAWATAEAYRSDETNPALRETLRARSNGLVIASGAASAVALGGVTLALVQVRW